MPFTRRHYMGQSPTYLHPGKVYVIKPNDKCTVVEFDMEGEVMSVCIKRFTDGKPVLEVGSTGELKITPAERKMVYIENA